MRKWLIKFMTVVLSVVVSAGFAGCNLVTTNNARDLDQVVAVVNVTQKEEIYKKDLVMQYVDWYYNQNGYMYFQSGSITPASVYKQILNSLIENRIMVQYAYEAFENGNEDAGIVKTVVNESEPVYTAKRYLDGDEITEAEYTVYKSVNDLLDAYTDDDLTEKKDGFVGDVRTVPTGATNATEELSPAQKADYIAKGFDVTSSPERRAAFNSVISILKNNDLLGSGYKGEITETLYFKELLKSNYEIEIIKNYEEIILNSVLENLTYGDLEDAYGEKLSDQKNWSNSEFVSALSSATAASPILYSAYGTYGYVYNLLIGVNDYQSAKITELQEQRTENNMTDAEYSIAREKILEGTVAKDLRSSWILSGYDFNYDETQKTGVFTGDYTFTEDSANSLPFKGVVERVREESEDKKLSAVYNIASVNTFDLEGFLGLVKDYVYNNESLTSAAVSSDIYAAFTRSDKPAEYDAKIQELLFAFSTDSGSLNTYKGYVIKPAVDGADSEEYVKTFGDAGRQLLTEGGSSFKVVASDYGYHFMFFSEVWNIEDPENPRYATLDDYLDTLNIDKGSATWAEYFNEQKANWEEFEEENNFLYVLANEIISGKLSDATSKSRTAIVDKYRNEEKKVTVYYNKVNDLLKG